MYIDTNEKKVRPACFTATAGRTFHIDISGDVMRLFLGTLICLDRPQEPESLEPGFPVLPIGTVP